MQCEAEIRNKRALFVLENEWGKGLIDVGAMKRILTGDAACHCAPDNAHNLGETNGT